MYYSLSEKWCTFSKWEHHQDSKWSERDSALWLTQKSANDETSKTNNAGSGSNNNHTELWSEEKHLNTFPKQSFSIQQEVSSVYNRLSIISGTSQGRVTSDRVSELSIGKTYHCRRCGSVFKHPSSFGRHVRYECGRDPQFQCPVCSMKFKQKYNMIVHMRRHEK